MRLNKKKAIIVIAALIVICGASFFLIRSLNGDLPKKQSAVSVNAQPTGVTTTEPATTTQAAPSGTVPTQPTAQQGDLTTGQFTTFPADETGTRTPSSPGASTPATTQPTKSTTSTTPGVPTTGVNFPTVTQPTTQSGTQVPATTHTTVTTTEEAQQVIREANSHGLFGYQFDPVGQYYFTPNDPWQRNFGFNTLYDLGASFVNFYYDTFRCRFTYRGMDWLVQFWKGQYGLVFLGAEIGTYYKPLDREYAHYDAVSDDDALYMSMTLYRKGEERLTREYAKYWWCTGFSPGLLDSFRDRSELTLKARLTMKDQEMLQLFTEQLESQGHLRRDRDYTVSGLDVYLTWT